MPPRGAPRERALNAPWRDSLATRFGWLDPSRYRVAYLYEQPDGSTFRYRAYNMVDALNRGSRRVSAAWFFEDEWDALADRLGWVDAIVVCRCRYSYRLDTLLARARTRRLQVIYDVDDLVVDSTLVPLVAHTLAQVTEETWDYWFAYVGRLEAALRLCDRAIVTTPPLAEYLTQRERMPVTVVPNFMNALQLAVSQPLFEARAQAGFAAADGPVRLGYFSGTPSHNSDFEIVSDALARVLEREPRVRVRTVGYIQTSDPLARYSDRIDHHELTDFLTLQELVARTEVNLVPLQQNRFTDAKSELKYFEAAAVGTVSVASPTAVYRAAITDGRNGFLAQDHEWEDTLMTVVDDLLGGRELYAAMAHDARQDATARYSWQPLIPVIEGAVLAGA